ncbi:MAG TPA: ABC-type transport auxiliary lipoprotein family protein [Telluria sp.]
MNAHLPHLPRPLSAAALAAVFAAALLAGCSTNKAGPTNSSFDFGPAAGMPAAPQARSNPSLTALVVSDVTGPAALDSERMYYRLNYANATEARTYAQSRWSSNPLQMMTQRFKTRLSQAGMKVLSTTDAAAGIPILRVDVDDFVHGFSSASQSQGQVLLRASLFDGHTLIDQKTFSRSTTASSADAAGGARALAASTDAVAADIAAWLATLDLPRKR